MWLRQMVSSRNLDVVFYPRSVALIGASKEVGFYIDPISASRLREKFFLVNPRSSEISGLKCYPSILDVPEPVDYAIFAVPAKIVPEALEDCGRKGVRVAHIYSSGFSETGLEEGKMLEEEVLKIAKNYGIRVIGPNCMGVYCPESGLFFAHNLPSEVGSVAFVSQSGGQAVNFVFEGVSHGFSFSKVVSYGNALDVDFVELVDYLAEDPKTSIIGAYVEGLRKTEGLLETLKNASEKKPLVILKGGKTGDGARAAASHTGVLAGSAKIWEGFLKQVKAVSVDTFEDMADAIVGFLYAFPPKGRGVSIVTTSGGSAVIHTDLCVKVGLNVPSFSEETQGALRKIIPIAGASIRNPLDAWMAFQGGILPEALNTVSQDEYIHSLIIELQPGGFKVYTARDPSAVDKFTLILGETCKKIMNEHGKPTMIVVTKSIYSEFEAKIKNTFQNMNLPVYQSIYDAAKALSKLYQHQLSREVR
ncbi:MAG: acetate--CoA ligase family protein [Candidatus Jordarchaeum sp.]|uniref:acetate--CoA ligase family protein n=1 Tax=Candidatus Jordarchaeum sp. TaxID=2823881 RepID=UPI00404B4A31